MPTIRRETRDGQLGPIKSKGIAVASSAAKTVIDRIAPIGFAADDGISMLLWGQSGTGKTTIAATFPKPALWILCSSKEKPGELRSIDTPDNRRAIRQVAIRNTDEFREVIEYCRAFTPFKTVVLDHATGFQDMVLKEILGLDELPVQKSWGMTSQQLYGQMTGAAKDLLKKMLDLTCNVVFIAHYRHDKDESGADNSDGLIQPYVGPSLTPQLAGWLNREVDYIGHTFKRNKMTTKRMIVGEGKDQRTVDTEVRTKEKEYCLRVGPDATYCTKFRLPKGGNVLPDVLVDPDYDQIISLVRGGN